jgi:hypothetical protein
MYGYSSQMSMVVSTLFGNEMAPLPVWVVKKLRELIADGLNAPLAAAQLTAMGHVCSARQVRRWKVSEKIVQYSRCTDAELDAVVQRVRAAGGAGPNEGFRWVHSAINKELAPCLIGRDRVRKSLLRLFPEEVAVRKLIVEKRLIRRVYTAPYYLHAGHLDYNCKATLPGGVRLYSYGHVRARAPASHAAPHTRFHLPF